MSVFSIVILLTILQLASAQNANDIGCYIYPDVDTIAENDKLSLLTGSDSDETCIARCQGTGASIAGVKWLEGTDVLGMCACLTLSPGAHIYKFSCCEGKAKFKISSFGYKAYNISIHDKQIDPEHFYSTHRNELCEGAQEEMQSDLEEPIKLTDDFQNYNTTEILITFTLDDQKNKVFCPNNDIDRKRKDYSSVTKTFDAFLIPGPHSSSQMCKHHCVLNSRFTKHSYKYFVVTTDNDENLEFCDCFREFPVALRSIQQCFKCPIDNSDSCFKHNVTHIAYLMESPSNSQLTSTTDGNNPKNGENNGISFGWIVLIIVGSLLFAIGLIIVAKLCYDYHNGNTEWRNMFCVRYREVANDEGDVQLNPIKTN